MSRKETLYRERTRDGSIAEHIGPAPPHAAPIRFSATTVLFSAATVLKNQVASALAGKRWSNSHLSFRSFCS